LQNDLRCYASEIPGTVSESEEQVISEFRT